MTLHIHAVNDPDLDAGQFHVSEDQLRAACPPELAGAVTFSAGGTDEVDAAAGADVLIGWTFPSAVLARTPDVSWLHVIGAGVDHLEPLDWVPDGARLTNSSGVHAAKAAEFVAAELLMLNSKMLLHLEEQQAHRWTPRYSTVIGGKTVLIVGVGTIGGAVARRAKELGLQVPRGPSAAPSIPTSMRCSAPTSLRAPSRAWTSSSVRGADARHPRADRCGCARAAARARRADQRGPRAASSTTPRWPDAARRASWWGRSSMSSSLSPWTQSQRCGTARACWSRRTSRRIPSTTPRRCSRSSWTTSRGSSPTSPCATSLALPGRP